MGTTRERFLRINFFALLFALFANFLGMTSFLLGLLPELQGLYIIPAELTQAGATYFPLSLSLSLTRSLARARARALSLSLSRSLSLSCSHSGIEPLVHCR